MGMFVGLGLSVEILALNTATRWLINLITFTRTTCYKEEQRESKLNAPSRARWYFRSPCFSEGREMVSREQKRAALHEKLQLLRSLTNSHALRKSSIILDASKYIQDLKQKVGRLKQEIACTPSQVLQTNNSSQQLCSPQVIVETLEKGFLINVCSEKSCPGLLASVLEAFEQLGLHVVEAKASCADAFRLVAIGREAESMEAQAVKEAVQRAVSCLFGEDSEEDMDD